MNATDHKSTAAGTYHLVVTGRVKEPVTLSMDKLRQMDMVKTDHLKMICGEGDVKGDIGCCTGVLLTDIINLAEVIAPEHNDTKKMYVVATSDDGYKTLFAWQELYNSDNGEGIIVVLERDGVPVYDNYASADLVSARDILTGPRHVRDIRSIDIRILE